LAHPDVKYIEADQVVSINWEQDPKAVAPLATITQTGATWGISRIWQKTISTGPPNTFVYNDLAGKGVDVFVIDTGIFIQHNDFGGRASFPFNSVPGEGLTDGNGHGTHCAGTIGGTTFGVAKQVNLFAVKVLSAAGSGTTAGVAAGVDYVTNSRNKANAAIASMSLGGGASAVMDDAVIQSIANGVTYAIAAGNNNANACNYSPARVATAVTVGATQLNTAAPFDTRASYSNFGTCVDIFAPGTSITSDWIGSATATNTISGTSMATPHVAGAIAVYFSQLGAARSAPAATKTWLAAQSTQGIVQLPGTGSPNSFLFLDPNWTP
jgi:subtilisin family serine protease